MCMWIQVLEIVKKEEESGRQLDRAHTKLIMITIIIIIIGRTISWDASILNKDRTTSDHMNRISNIKLTHTIPIEPIAIVRLHDEQLFISFFSTFAYFMLSDIHPYNVFLLSQILA